MACLKQINSQEQLFRGNGTRNLMI